MDKRQEPQANRTLPYKKGDFIGDDYEVYGTLGKGGFGVVYLVYSHETKYVYALKTFRDEYLNDGETRERFRKEAQVWVDLERHPYLVRASFVVDISGRLYIVLDYIAPAQGGLNSLQGYLDLSPPDLAQSLRWAIEFCHGMEHAYSRGIRCHRDIKPANILISQDKTVKISDFGLAGVLGSSRVAQAINLNIQNGLVGLSGQTMVGIGFGTPTHMPPEQFSNAATCDQRSDIYSFGVVLYQMASAGQLPFLAASPRDNSPKERERFWTEMQRLHSLERVPPLFTPLFPIIEQCLAKEPARRFQTFRELRAELEPLLRRETGEVINPPSLTRLEAWEWSNKGASLVALGRPEEALECYGQALAIDPQCLWAWGNRGISLAALGRPEEALDCFDQALAIDPKDARAWYNRGTNLVALGRRQEAVDCFDRALAFDPQDAAAWVNKGISLDDLGRPEEALVCYDQALAIDPKDAKAWHNRGRCLAALRRRQEAVDCYDQALAIDPQNAKAWYNKGLSLADLGRPEKALDCFDHALAIDSRYVGAWVIKGNIVAGLGRHQEAVNCFDRALFIDPLDAGIWSDRGVSLAALGRSEEAVDCYDHALAIGPQNANAWHNKGVSLAVLGRRQEALDCFDQALAIDPRCVAAWANKALAQEAMGLWRGAAMSYRKLIELLPHSQAEIINFAQKQVHILEGK